MSKKKILLAIPLAIICGILVYSFILILRTNIIPVLQYYLAAGLFIGLICLFFTSFSKTVIATCIYLFLASINIIYLFPYRNESWFSILGFEMPHFQVTSFGIFILFCILNFDTVVNMYLDHKQKKQIR